MEQTPIEAIMEKLFKKLRASHPAFHYDAQHKLMNYRADFVVWATIVNPIGDLKLLKYVIECDGHDFHEKTKQQAAYDKKRDRDMQQLGFKVLRFSGSEIVKNPNECFIQIINQMEADNNAS